MTRILLLSDPEHFGFFSSYLATLPDVELAGTEADVIFDAGFLRPADKLERLSKIELRHPLIVTNTLTTTTTTVQAVLEGVNVIGIPMLPNYFARQKTLEFSFPFGKEGDKPQAESVIQAIGKTGENTQDSIAGVFPRTLAMIINEAAFALQEGVATAIDIDTSMKLGTNYPKGPLAWCDEIGAPVIVAILEALGKEYGTERYKIASRLRMHAEARIPFHASAPTP